MTIKITGFTADSDGSAAFGTVTIQAGSVNELLGFILVVSQASLLPSLGEDLAKLGDLVQGTLDARLGNATGPTAAAPAEAPKAERTVTPPRGKAAPEAKPGEPSEAERKMAAAEEKLPPIEAPVVNKRPPGYEAAGSAMVGAPIPTAGLPDEFPAAKVEPLELPQPLKVATTFRAVVMYFVENGVLEEAAILEQMIKYAKLAPVLQRAGESTLKDRLSRAMVAMADDIKAVQAKLAAAS